MQNCNTCGAPAQRPISVDFDGKSGVYDSFECAIHDVAERCSHCDCVILGHAVYAGEAPYCCEHCSGRS